MTNNLQLAEDKHNLETHFLDLLNPGDFSDCGGKCCTLIIKQSLSLVGSRGEDANKADDTAERTHEEITFIEEREKLDGVPVTKFTTEDKELFDELLPKHYQGQDNKAQRRTVVNHVAMCFEFNAAARDEQSKPMGQRKRIFAKTAALLKEHHKSKMRIENEEAT